MVIEPLGLIDMNSAIEREHGKCVLAHSSVPSVSRMSEANGRMYAPLQGRFLSPDKYIQSPDNPQNYI